MSKLVIVESPTKAKTIEKFLGPGYVVKATLGHVRDLPKRRLGVKIEGGFEPMWVVPKEKKEIVKELVGQIRKAKELYLATDPDREGEAIAWHLLQAAKPQPGQSARRIIFYEVTHQAVHDALARAREIDLDLVRAQQARRVVDRLLGYKLSPLLWSKVKKGLSAGRVQSVAVRLLVEREREIERFRPQEYWTVDALLEPPRVDGAHRRAREPFLASLLERNGEQLELPDEVAAQAAAAALERADLDVAEVRWREVQRQPAAPFITSTLQQEAARRLGFSAKRTMTVAQQLYEGLEVPGEGQVGLITYMRTDSTQVAKEAQKEALAFIEERFGAEYVPPEPRVFKTVAKAAQEAHEAVRPTSVQRTPERLKGHVTADQFRLYRLIWKRFVSSQMAGALLESTAVDVLATAHPAWGTGGALAEPVRESTAVDRLAAVDRYLLRATGSVVRFPGFLKLYEESVDEGQREEKKRRPLPPLAEGERLALLEVRPEQHFTQPRPRYTEASLIRSLEEDGIGRPSTYAPILSTIQERGYVQRVEKQLRPTELGTIVNDLLVQYFPDVVEVGFTAQIEEDVDEVAEGHKDWVAVVEEFWGPFSADLERASAEMEKVELAMEPTDELCEVCGRPMVIKLGRYGRFVACSGFPECRFTRTLLTKIGVPCPQCGGEIVERKTRRGRTFYGCSNFPACTFATWHRVVPELCPACGGLQVFQPRGVVVCQRCGRTAEAPPPESEAVVAPEPAREAVGV